ncbi:MAG: hypothetical protein FJW64_09915 [Actinobacteria bacterium]|nr:hypothetical protein [Actinomycetota bacterium]
MRNTHRGVNRTLLFIVGLILLAKGALLVLLVALPGTAGAYTSVADGVRGWAESVGQPAFSWIVVAILAVLAVLLVVIAAAAVRGRHGVPLQATGSDEGSGRITVTNGFASEALQNALSDRDEILSARITSGEVRDEPVLHVAVTPRQNTSPREVATHVDTLVSNLGTLTGQSFRTYISIHSGLRAKLAHDNTRVR